MEIPEAFAFIGSAGYSIVEIRQIYADGTVDVVGERPCDKFQYELTTTLAHICIR